MAKVDTGSDDSENEFQPELKRFKRQEALSAPHEVTQQASSV